MANAWNQPLFPTEPPPPIEENPRHLLIAKRNAAFESVHEAKQYLARLEGALSVKQDDTNFADLVKYLKVTHRRIQRFARTYRIINKSFNVDVEAPVREQVTSLVKEIFFHFEKIREAVHFQKNVNYPGALDPLTGFLRVFSEMMKRYYNAISY